MAKMIFFFFFFFFCLMAEFHRVVWTINALLTVCFEMLPFSGNNQNINMFGVSPNICHNLPLGNFLHVQWCHSKLNFASKVWWCFLINSCIFWRSRNNLSNSTKTILWLLIKPIFKKKKKEEEEKEKGFCQEEKYAMKFYRVLYQKPQKLISLRAHFLPHTKGNIVNT